MKRGITWYFKLHGSQLKQIFIRECQNPRWPPKSKMAAENVGFSRLDFLVWLISTTMQKCKTVPFTKTENGSVSLIWWKYFAGSFRHDEKIWNFVTKKITNGVNKVLSFFCLILNRCICIIFSKISLVTSHGAFSTWFYFTAGNTPCRKINQSTKRIHSVPSVLVFWTEQVETARLKCSAVFGRCLTREQMQKK